MTAVESAPSPDVGARLETGWVVRIRGLTLGYGRAPVLRDVTLEIGTGDAWFLIGPNGSGKTTLLRALLGLLPVERGRIERHPSHASRERLGFVPQSCDFNPSLPTTLREFVSLGFVRSGIARGDRDARLAWALERVGLRERTDASYWALSGGQRRRALLARALVRGPSLLVLDEPTEGLDVKSEHAFLETLTALRRAEGITLLLVTHKLSLAARYATHVALFHDGRVASGPRESMLEPQRLERIFGAALDPSTGSVW